jgi:transposase
VRRDRAAAEVVARQVQARLANMPPCLIGMEACVGAHHLSRGLQLQGRDARLMPAKYVRPYSNTQLETASAPSIEPLRGLLLVFFLPPVTPSAK